MEYLRALRLAELEDLIDWFPAGARVLEIGAGAGWQSRALAERGFHVEAVDIAGSEYAAERVFPVAHYDGHRLPFPDGRFGVVFSSNVLEHVYPLEPLLDEMRRVMRPDGVGIHLMPTAAWRGWTTLVHAPHYLKLIALKLGVGRSRRRHVELERFSLYDLVAILPRPPRHGCCGSAWSELGRFSRRRWLRVFAQAGWRTLAVRPNRLFYTGYAVMESNLPLKTRRVLSRWLGSSCLAYQIQPRRAPTP